MFPLLSSPFSFPLSGCCCFFGSKQSAVPERDAPKGRREKEGGEIRRLVRRVGKVFLMRGYCLSGKGLLTHGSTEEMNFCHFVAHLSHIYLYLLSPPLPPPSFPPPLKKKGKGGPVPPRCAPPHDNVVGYAAATRPTPPPPVNNYSGSAWACRFCCSSCRAGICTPRRRRGRGRGEGREGPRYNPALGGI